MCEKVNVSNAADLVLLDANVITTDPNDTRAEAIAVKNGKISMVGPNEAVKQLIGKKTKILKLGGKTVLPGFIDTHVHFRMTGTMLAQGIDLWRVCSIKEILQKISERKEKIPKGELIWGYRLDESRISDKRFPTRWELDKVAPNHYVLITNVELHSCAVNTQALNFLNFPEGEPGVDKDPKTGELTGVLRDPAFLFALKRWNEWISDEVRKKSIKIAAEEAVKLGLTTVHAIPFTDRDVELLLQYAEELPVGIVLYEYAANPSDVDKIIKKGIPKVGVKILTDGAFGAHTAALFDPYTDDPTTKGELIFTNEELNEMVLKAHKAGLQLAIHAVAEAAIKQVLDAYENALKNYPKADHRHRIEHFELPTEDQIKRTAKLGVSLAMQPQHMYLLNYKEFIGDRVTRGHPYKSILEEGVLVAGGSDSPIVPMGPLFCVHCLANMPYFGQRVGVKEALKMNTINGAKMNFEEDRKGTIEAGKLADLVVLSDDPYAVKPDKIKDISVSMTIVGGKIVYEKPVK